MVKCLTCGALKRFLAREGHQLWSQQQEEGEEEEVEADQHQEPGGSAGDKGQLELVKTCL